MKKQGKSSPSGVGNGVMGMMMIIIILVLAHVSIAAIATSANNNNGTIIITRFQRRVLAQVQSKTQQTFNPNNAAFKASKSGLYYYGSSPKNPAGGSSHCNPWRPLPRKRLKANADAAFHKDISTAALVVVVRDWQGKVITGTLVQAIKSRMPIVEADAIFRDILQLLEETPDVGATWTPRDGNKLAHQLAATAAGNDLLTPEQLSTSVKIF